MSPALIVGRRTESARWLRFQRDSIDESVKAQIEVKARLLAVGDHIEPRRHLVMNRGDDRIFLQFSQIVGAELVELRCRQLQPRRKRMASND